MPKEARMELLRSKGKMWGDDEIRFHIAHMLKHPANVANADFATVSGFVTIDPLMLTAWDSIGPAMCTNWCKHNRVVPDLRYHIVTAFLHAEHWFPVWMVPHGRTLVVYMIDDPLVDPFLVKPLVDILQTQFGFAESALHTFPSSLPQHEMFGAAAIAFLGHIMVGAALPQTLDELGYYHSNMKASFVHALYADKCCICPVAWGAGQSNQLAKLLGAELLKHGVPDDQVEKRAIQAIQVIGGEQIQKALGEKNVWRSLKILGNNARFQFLLPAELATLAVGNKGLSKGKRSKIGLPQVRPHLPDAVDPSKLALPDGFFHANGNEIHQISPKQIGPVASGVALITLEESLPYLKAGKMVSNEPLALAVFTPAGHVVDTALPHCKIMLPCVCVANHEPLLTEAVIVQLGRGFVEKQVVSTAISMDQLEVATVKFMVYKDEFSSSWDEFLGSPIKHLVRSFPLLRRCQTAACQCDAWHNVEGLPLQDPIMDVWRRQHLTAGFKTTQPAKSEIFSVCIRIPSVILPHLLAMSGTSGAYTEPRTPDGKDVLEQYVVVWASKMSPSELAHVRQTNPVVIGVARLGDRRGLRVPAEKAQTIHEILRPDAAFLPSGPKLQYVAGPFPWGSDRNAINKALKQAGWTVKALQPMQPIPGQGSMWILQCVDTPPQSIFHMAHGEVVVTKHRQSNEIVRAAPVATVGSAKTLTLCSAAYGSKAGELDPWLANDPWASYAKNSKPDPTPASAGLQQLEDRIQSAVLAKLPSTMEQDDVPDRLGALENQVHMLMTKHQSLEGQFTEFSNQNTQQFAVVQQQIQQQSQTFHGQLENHTQSVQAMFESQMHQIRNLLSKRPP